MPLNANKGAGSRNKTGNSGVFLTEYVVDTSSIVENLLKQVQQQKERVESQEQDEANHVTHKADPLVVLSTHARTKFGVDMRKATSRAEGKVTYMPVMAKRPQDTTLYRVMTPRRKQRLSKLTLRERIQLERRETTRVLDMDLKKIYPRPKIHGGSQFLGPERDDHFLTKIYFPNRIKKLEPAAEELAVEQALLRARRERFPRPKILGGWLEQTDREKHFYSKFLISGEHRKPQKNRYSRKRVANKFHRGQSKRAQSVPSFEYMDAHPTCVFDKSRAKVDRKMQAGDVLDWSRMTKRKPPQVIHYDTDYHVRPQSIEPEPTCWDFGSQIDRESKVSHLPQPEYLHGPTDYDVKKECIESKVKGGRWNKTPSRPAPKRGATQLYKYDFILKRLKQRKKRERNLMKQTIQKQRLDEPRIRPRQTSQQFVNPRDMR